MGVLDEIVAHKREELAARRAARPPSELEAACRGLAPARDFAEALTPGPGRRVRLIAEVKKASPSKGVLAADLDVDRPGPRLRGGGRGRGVRPHRRALVQGQP